MVLSFAPMLRAESEDQRFVAGLRERRLFELAERFCEQRLADENNALGERERAELVIEQIRNYAGHAINSPPQDRDALWNKAAGAAENFRLRDRDNPRLVLVRVQAALAQLARGELLRQEAEVGAGPENAQEKARAEIRAAADSLNSIAAELVREIPLKSRAAPRGDEPTAGELLSLENNARYHLARAYRNQALLYPPGSDDRVGALVEALGELDTAHKQLPEGDPLNWQIALDRAVCQRLLGDTSKAQETLAALEPTAAPPEIKLAARAEQARLALAGKRYDEALGILSRGRTLEGKTSPELDLALLEAYLAQWQAAAEKKDETAAQQWQQKAVAAVRLIEAQQGPYWGRRADLLLVRSAEHGTGGADVEVLSRTADNFYLQKQYDEAIDAYDKAAEKALAAQDKDKAFTLLYKAAAVAHQLARREQASRRMRRLAIDFKTNARAPQVHLQAVLNEAQRVKDDPALLSQYVVMLEEHLAQEGWKDSPTTDQAAMWLGMIREQQHQWPEAIQAYLRVSPAFSQYASAVEAAARCSAPWFAELKASGRPYDEQARAAAEYFENLVYDKDRRLPQRWDDVARLAAVTAARIRLQHTSGGHAAAAALLEPALAGSPDSPPDWKAAATSLLVVALAGQDSRRGEAQQRIRDLADGNPQELLDMLVGLADAAQSAGSQSRSQMAALLLDASKLLEPKRGSLDAGGRFTLARVEAEALAALGRQSEGVAVYEEFARKHPDDGAVQRGYAEFLLAADDERTLAKALDQWRLVAAHTRPRTDAWYQAKYSVAKALFKLRRKDEAAKLIRFMQVTPPGLEQTDLKPAFLDLLRRCQS